MSYSREGNREGRHVVYDQQWGWVTQITIWYIFKASIQMLETCSTIIRGAITRVRRAKQELRKVEVAVNIDTNCGNLNMHCT